MNRFSCNKLVILAIFFFPLLSANAASAAVHTWDGGGATNNWSDAANWSGDVVPQDSDEVVFDSTSTKNAIIDINLLLLRFNINAGFSGTVSLGSSSLALNSHFTQAAGVFDGGNGTIHIGADLVLSGGTFVATNGTTTFGSELLMSGTGNFDHNGGTVVFRSGLGTANVLVTEDFFNLEVNLITNSAVFGPAVGDTLRVVGNLILTNGQLAGTGTIEATAAVSIAPTFDGGDGLLLISGNNTRTITLLPSSQLPRIRVNAPNATINTSGPGTINCRTMEIQNVSLITNGAATFSFQFAFSYIQTGGTFVGGTGGLFFRNTFLVSGGSFTASSGSKVFMADVRISGSGSFEHNNGTVVFTRSVDLDVLLIEEFNNVSINSIDADTLVIAAGDTLRVLGELNLTDGDVSGGALEVHGNVTISPAFDGGSASIQFAGTNNQVYTNTGGINPSGVWTINKSTGTVTLASDLDLSNGTSDLVLTAGTITTGANLVNAGTRTITRTGGFVNGNLRRNFMSIGAQRFDVGTNSGYSPATIDATAGVFGAGTTVTVGANAGTLPGAAPLQLLTRNWSINASPGGITNANLRLDYLQGDVPVGANENAFVFLRRSGGTTSVQGITSIDVVNNFATLNNVTSLSDWSLGTFVPTAAGVSVGGRVVTVAGRGVSKARLSLTGADRVTRTAVTNPFGYFRFDDVVAGEGYVLSVDSKNYEFEVSSIVLNVTDNITDLILEARPLPDSASYQPRRELPELKSYL